MTNTDKYADLRAALPELVAEARRQGGTNPRAQMIIDLLADHDALYGVLETISAYPYTRDQEMGITAMRKIARDALAQLQGEKHG